MLRGAPLERQLMDDAAAAISSRTNQLNLQRFLSESLDTYVLRFCGILAAFTAMLPAVIDSHVGAAASSEEPTEYFLTCLHLLVNVGMALKDLVLSHKAAATTRGLATRVAALVEALETSAPPAPPPASPAAAAVVDGSTTGAPLLLRVRSLAVALPDGSELLKDIDFELCAGHRVLLCGANGVGKSSLLRALAGVWPAKAGDISWFVPPSDRLVLPQRPYLLPGASLKQNLLYPASEASEPWLWRISESELLSALEIVGLAQLAPSAAALHVAGLCDGLSPGEQQRIGLARLLIRRPALAVLDEPCSAIDPAFESKFFEECAHRQMTLLTVSHRRDISQYYTHKLRLDGSGSAALSPVDSKANDDSSASDEFVIPSV